MNEDAIIVHTDGGSRGNPGPAACAFVITYRDKEITRQSKYLGERTNNFAEYQGVILALQYILENRDNWAKGKKIFFLLDSELIVRQINGVYKVKDEKLKTLHGQVKDLVAKIHDNVFFRNVPREKNKYADMLVNEELDKNLTV